MTRLLFILIVGAALAVAESKTYSGVITDTMCGADHAHMKVAPDAKCVRECARSGQYKYALLTSDGKVHVLSDQAAPEKFAAQQVKVTGTLYPKTGILKVEKIEAAR